jgi:hypothetical protein
MNIVFRRIAVTAALLCLVAAGINFMKAQTSVKPPSTPQATSSAMAASPNVAQLQSTANQAAARIQASSSDTNALVSAVRTKNVDRASALLLQNGFTSKQLEGAKIELVDNTGGKGGGGGTASKVKVTIRVSCCPFNLTIIISF